MANLRLYQNKNKKSKAYGKYYGRVKATKTLNTTQLAQHIAEHGSIITEDVLLSTINKMTKCIKELLKDGKNVKLDGLGTFYPSIESTGSNTVLDYDPLVHIKGVHMNFRPEAAGDADEKLTSRVLKDQCTFKMNDYVIQHTKTVDGKEKVYYERHPIATYGVANAEEDEEQEP